MNQKSLSPQDMQKVAGVNTSISAEHAREVCTETRVYAYLDKGACAGQIVAIQSPEKFDGFVDDAQFMFASDLTMVPVRRA